MTSLQPLVVTMGEPSGIGPDIIVSAWSQRAAYKLPFFYVVGDVACLSARARSLGLDVPVEHISSGKRASEVFDQALPVCQADSLPEVVPGQLSNTSGAFVINAIRRAVQDIFEGHASGLVTGPIHKAALYESGFKFPGHTEYLAALSYEIYGQSCQPVMMLICDDLRVVPLTIHVPLQQVSGFLSEPLIVETTHIVSDELQRKFGIKRPRVFMTGLNPHAGEDGMIGREEIEIIAPAIERLKSEGIDVSGPFSADTCFHRQARARYDAVIAMYHDQALIPIKTLNFDEGVNVTLGLPFIRTSPDHGTALSLAGGGQTSDLSFISALRAAQLMASNISTEI